MAEIDWNQLWQEKRDARTCKGKGRKDWDKKAVSFARRNQGSSYVSNLIDFISPDPGATVLDVGCGPGTLAVPLASKVARVTALDFSENMLAELEQAASRAGVTNITSRQLAWEDDWRAAGIGVHDIGIASRSLSVHDLAAALTKLNDFSRQKVYITDRVGAGPFDPDVFAAVGRPFEPGPDYIYTFNLLHQMGIHARVDYVDAEYQGVYETREEAVDSYLWMLDGLTGDEEPHFAAFINERLRQLPDGGWQYERRQTPKWAVIWWNQAERGGFYKKI